MRIQDWLGRSAAAALLIALSVPAGAMGLRSPLGEVVLKDLKIGQTYSMHKLLNLPLRVVNTSDEDVDLKIETTTVNDLLPGYAPASEWVSVSLSTFTLGPNREAVTDLILSIPNDPKLLGRRFQADVWSHTTNARSVLVGIQSRLLLQIDSTPPTEEELKKKYVDETVANLDFTVLPVHGEASDVPLGRKLDLRKDRKLTVKLINPNDRPLNFRVRSIPAWESVIQIPEGFTPADDASWLRPEKDVVKVEGNSIADTSFSLDIPDRPNLRGKKFFFVVSFEVLEQKIPTRVYYRFAVETQAPNPASADKAGK